MTCLPTARRRWLAAVAAAGASLLLAGTGTAHAAPPVVEIIAFAHPPVQSALKPLSDWLATQGSRLKVVETDMETPAGEKRLQTVGAKGHVPVVVLIDGRYRHKRADGSMVDFLSFPAGPSAPPSFKGSWTFDEVKAAVSGPPAR